MQLCGFSQKKWLPLLPNKWTSTLGASAFARAPVKMPEPVVTWEGRIKLLLLKWSVKASTERKSVVFGKVLGNSLEVWIRKLRVHGNTKVQQMEEKHIYHHHVSGEEVAFQGDVSCIEAQQCPLLDSRTGDGAPQLQNKAEHSKKTRRSTRVGTEKRRSSHPY